MTDTEVALSSAEFAQLTSCANQVLSAANLGQLVRQLVAIDALSYVQSQ